MTQRNDFELEVDVDNPLGDLTTKFILALLNADRHLASDLIMDFVKSNEDVKQVYLHVFQKSQREIGRLWQTGQISVAQEHFCTAATQVIMSQLYPYIFTNEKIGRRLVATCVGGELHEIGVRMVSDFFEMNGWDTYYLGANTPASGIIQAIEEQNAEIVGISTTMYYNVGAVKKFITEIRSADIDQRFKVMVGGYPFLISEHLWKDVGADGFAKDAESAVEIAEKLITAG